WKNTLLTVSAKLVNPTTTSGGNILDNVITPSCPLPLNSWKKPLTIPIAALNVFITPVTALLTIFLNVSDFLYATKKDIHKATTPAVIQPTGPVITLIDVASLGNTACKPPIKLPASLAINDILPREPASAPNVVNIPPVTVTNLPNIVSSGPTVTKVIA